MRGRNLIVGITAVVLFAGAGYGIFHYLSKPSKPARPKAQQIAVLRQQPPPPPPKPQEKPKEPELKKEEVKLPDPAPEPKAADNEPPPAQDLGIDAQGGAGSDGFGLQGRPGGRDITTIGGTGDGTGLGRAQYAFYSGLVQTHLQEALGRDRRLRAADYRATVRVWFAADGRIQRVELVDGSGDATIDAALRQTIADAAPMKQPPPPEMPQPVKLQVTSRGAG